MLFATAVNDHYRYSSADNILNAPATREVFIRDILNGNYDIDYPAQSINNIGFRYKKFKSAEDVYRYSNDYSAYLTVFEGTNVTASTTAVRSCACSRSWFMITTEQPLL